MSDRAYAIRGLRVPGVTDVTRILNKPGLNLYREGLGTAAANEEAELTSQRGTRVHRNALLLCRGKPVLPGDPDPAVDTCTENLRTWLAHHLVKPLLAEKPVYSQGYLFAGRPDLVAIMRLGIPGDTFWVIDWKASRAAKPPYYEWDLQTAGYALTDEVRELAGRATVNRATITINPEGDCTPHVWAFGDSSRRKQSFLWLLSIYGDMQSWNNTKHLPI